MKNKRPCLFVLIMVLGIGSGQAIAFDPDAALREARERERLEADRPALEIASQRYSVKGRDRGIAVDRVTGLEWMRCSLGQTWYPQSDTCQGQASRYNWDDAILLPQLMNEAGGYGGYKDWRVPTIDELRTLVFCSRRTPPIDPEGGRCPSGSRSPTIFWDMFPNTPTGNFWSASPYDSYYSDSVWRVGFRHGSAHGFSGTRSGHGHVRLVRGRQ
ncbi:Lcl C-terminal domain-containing protein [Thioalkalivibrio paradoxus]|uniref:Lcl C-terminal domain-containing protein n=1 Tax=Thioalkalivibrio paradoxus TaxID=108010 RepID=UPI0012EB0E73|nr:DUF1566 domain-containing protein [Thioalkalivibrio paradoxus]